MEASNTPTPEPSSESPSASPTPTPTPSATVASSLEELQEAVSEATGGDCAATWDPDEEPGPANSISSGWCVDHTFGISFYDSIPGRNEVLELNTTGYEYQDFVVGPDWLITTDDDRDALHEVAELTGGFYWTRETPIPTS